MLATFLTTKKNFKKGFSLIETVLYVVLLALIMSVLVQMLISLSSVYKNIKLARELEVSGSITLEAILREIHNASSVDLAGSSFNVNPGELSLSGFLDDLTPYSVVFDVSSGTVRISRNGSSPSPISSSIATTSFVIFRHFSNAVSEGVRVEIEVSGQAGNTYKSQKFYGFAVLRGSY